MDTRVMTRRWRVALLLLIMLGSLAALLLRPRFGQDPHYHEFADSRMLLGVPNFADVVSNLAFLAIGLAGLRYCRRGRGAGAVRSWTAFFTGITLVAFGSAYYHWSPDNDRQVWDRLPMTVAFMALFVALLSESLQENLDRKLLPPALLLGLSSVLYWHWTDDLRFYAWVQLLPLVMIPAVLAFYPARYTHRSFLLLALGSYAAAKVTEIYDREIFIFTGNTIGGHALKHILAAAGIAAIVAMLVYRKKTPDPVNRRGGA